MQRGCNNFLPHTPPFAQCKHCASHLLRVPTKLQTSHGSFQPEPDDLRTHKVTPRGTIREAALALAGR